MKKNKKQFRSVFGVRYHICETLLQKLDSLKNWEDLKKSGKKAYLPLIRDGIWPVRICWLPVWWPSRCVLLYVDCTEYRRPDQTMIDHRYSTQQRKHRYRNSSGRTLVLPVKKKKKLWKSKCFDIIILYLGPYIKKSNWKIEFLVITWKLRPFLNVNYCLYTTIFHQPNIFSWFPKNKIYPITL